MFNSKQPPIKICSETIHPGESISLALHLPELYSCLPAYMPIKVFHGKKPGPCLLVFAAVNGDELNGIEIINRLVQFKRLNKIAGTLIAVPVVNVFALANKSKFLPGNILLNESFPGSPTGTHGDRVANLFIKELFELADYAVSLETGPLNYSNLPEILINLKDEETKQLAEIFGAPVISQAQATSGTLYKYAFETQKKLITYVAGEANRFEAASIKVGLKGIFNILRHLKMLPQQKAKATKPAKIFTLESSTWVRATCSGVSTNKVKLGQQVEKNTILSMINDPFGNITPQAILSPKGGVVVGINNVPLIKEGEALFKIAFFPDTTEAPSHLEDWGKLD